MSKYYRHLIEAGLLLDIYPNAAVAYSLRKLRSGYKQSYNLWSYSEELQQSVWAKTNLTVTTDTLVAPDGNTTGDILYETVTSGTHVMGRTLVVTAGSEYTVSFWVQPQGRTFIRVNAAVNLSWDGTTTPSAWIDLSTGTIISQSAGYGGTFQITTAPNGWFLINYTVRAVNNATSQTIELNLSTNGSQIAYVGNPTLGVAVWGLQVTQSTTVLPYEKTVVAPSNGNAIRVRRTSDNTDQDFGFDSSGNLDVNSIENFVGYNLFAWSEELQQTYWNKTSVTPTPNIIVAPDGNTTGDILYEDAVINTHSVQRTLTVIAGREYTVSFWVKPEGRDFISVRANSNLSTNNISQPVAFFDLTTGTKISDNGLFRVVPTITPAPNGWFFITYGLIANTNATTTALQLNLSTDGSTVNYLGDITKGIGVWGIQITQSSTLRPYRKTLAVAEGQGFITTWYDQSGNGNNATQLTPSSQAQIVINGNIIIDTTTLKPTTTWTADSYGLINGVNPNTRYLSVSVNTRLTINDEILHLGTTNNPGTVNGQQSLRWRGGDGLIQSFRHNQSSHGLITTNGSYIIMSEKDSTNLKSVYINGFVNSSGTEVPANGTFMNQFGRSSAVAATTAQYQEFIYWDSEQSANRANIETLINNYYAIY